MIKNFHLRFGLAIFVAANTLFLVACDKQSTDSVTAAEEVTVPEASDAKDISNSEAESATSTESVETELPAKATATLKKVSVEAHVNPVVAQLPKTPAVEVPEPELVEQISSGPQSAEIDTAETVSSSEDAAAKEAAALPEASEESTADSSSTQLSEAPSVEVSESELVELFGYLTAQGGGVWMLQLDEAGVTAIADGLKKGITGELKLQDFEQEAIQAAFGQAQARAQAVEASAAELPVIDTDALQKIGLVMVGQSGIVQLGFGAENAAAITKGFVAGANATEPDPEIEAKMPAFQKFMEARVAMAQAAALAEAEVAAAEGIAAGVAFFEQLDLDPEVQKTDSGLRYKVLEPGSDVKPVIADKVLVHYKGALIDGTQFDSSYDRGAPAEFPLNAVVPGFGEGLTKVGAGGKIILYIPSKLGYGNTPRPGGLIKPGDTLIFECELIEINPES